MDWRDQMPTIHEVALCGTEHQYVASVPRKDTGKMTIPDSVFTVFKRGSIVGGFRM